MTLEQRNSSSILLSRESQERTGILTKVKKEIGDVVVVAGAIGFIMGLALYDKVTGKDSLSKLLSDLS